MDRFPWPLPLPGRDVRLQLVNPARKRFRTAAWMGAAGLFCMVLGPVRGDRGEYGAMIALCGGALFILAVVGGLIGLRHAFRRDLVLIVDREGVTVPRILNFLGGIRRATWAQIAGTSLVTKDGIYTGIVDAVGKLGLGQDQLPEGWNVSELMWRIQVRLLLVHHAGDLDPLQAAGLEALGIYGSAAEGAVVVAESDGPTVIDLVATPDEYLAQVASYPAEHKVLVRSDAVTAWTTRAAQNLVELRMAIPPRTT
jgi:hypothetical protein